VLDVPLENGGMKNRRHSPSLDRIDIGKGYEPGNIAVISHRANQLKSDGTLEEHKKLVRWMTQRLNPENVNG
jgi:hypothetical protein